MKRKTVVNIVNPSFYIFVSIEGFQTSSGGAMFNKYANIELKAKLRAIRDSIPRQNIIQLLRQVLDLPKLQYL